MALSASLKLRIGAIFILGSISLIGILIPLVVSEAVFKSDFFHVIKATAAGVMLGLCLVSGQLTHCSSFRCHQMYFFSDSFDA